MIIAIMKIIGLYQLNTPSKTIIKKPSIRDPSPKRTVFLRPIFAGRLIVNKKVKIEDSGSPAITIVPTNDSSPKVFLQKTI